MSRMRWLAILVPLLAIGAAAALYGLRATEKPCSNYNAADAVSYANGNMEKQAFHGPDSPGKSDADMSEVCKPEDQEVRKDGDVFIVNLCSKSSKKHVGHAEIYPDCGLEWRNG